MSADERATATTDSVAPPGWYPTAYGWQWWDGRQWYPPAPALSGAADERMLAVLSHLGPLIGGLVLPLVMFLIAKDKPYLRHHACEALNFAITHLIATLASFILIIFGLTFSSTLDSDATGNGTGVLIGTAFGVGFLLVFVVVIGGIVFAIVGAVKASRMEWWRYPINIRFVKP